MIVTHDIGVIANIADRVAVMYRGEVVEIGEVAQILGAPQHEYTKSLIAAVPRADRRLKRFTSIDYIEGGAKPFARIDVQKHWLGAAPQIAAQGENAVEVKNLEASVHSRRSRYSSKIAKSSERSTMSR